MDALKLQRILFLLLTMLVVFNAVYVLLFYVSVYYSSFEYLNSNPKYFKIKEYKIYNWFFVAYFAFVVLVRIHVFGYSETINYHLNTVEHLFFACIICQTISIYMRLFDFLPEKFLLKLMSIFTLFNGIGILNEYFQNLYQNTPMLRMDAADRKDLAINLIGSAFFVLISVLHWMKNQTLKEPRNPRAA
ncbi:hypothetical protein [Flavobacterium sp.]